MTTTVTLRRQPDGTWVEIAANCSARVTPGLPPPPMVTGQMVRAQAERLLPHPQIGVAPTDGTTLVNIQTILWIETAVDRNLGTVNLLGRNVTIAAHLQRVDWRFGDGTSASSDGPGRAYSDADPCSTVRCPGYFGHVYATTGRLHVTATLTWTGTYRIDGGASQPIPGTVNTDAQPTEVHVVESRSELVPNP